MSSAIPPLMGVYTTMTPFPGAMCTRNRRIRPEHNRDFWEQPEGVIITDPGKRTVSTSPCSLAASFHPSVKALRWPRAGLSPRGRSPRPCSHTFWLLSVVALRRPSRVPTAPVVLDVTPEETSLRHPVADTHTH